MIQLLIFAVYIWLVDSECLEYDKPCWIAVADGDVEPTGEEPLLQQPHHQTMEGRHPERQSPQASSVSSACNLQLKPSPALECSLGMYRSQKLKVSGSSDAAIALRQQFCDSVM